MIALLETLEIETAPSPRAAVIWMHGLGADGHDFAGIEREVTPPGAAVRYVYPHAPMMAVTINNGYVMRAWYDVFGVAGERREDEAGVRASQERIERLIAREKTRGIPARAIVLGGFSQGGAMALHTGLRHPERLAGVMALSCFLPVARSVATEASTANRDVSIFIAHGIADDLIPVARARAARDTLLGLGYEVEWHEYPMAHSLCPQEIEDIAAWLQRTLERKETP